MITFFHEDIQCTVCIISETSEAFPVSSGVKQGCVLALTFSGLFFSMLLQYAFTDCTDGIYIHTRADDKLFNIPHLHFRAKVMEVLICKMHSANNTALTSHTEAGLPQLMPVMCSGWPSAWKRQTSWLKMLSLPQTSPSMSALSWWFTPSPSSDQQSLAYCP